MYIFTFCTSMKSQRRFVVAIRRWWQRHDSRFMIRDCPDRPSFGLDFGATVPAGVVRPTGCLAWCAFTVL